MTLVTTHGRIVPNEAWDATLARIAELEAALRRFREMMDTSENFPTTCAEIANSIDDLLKRN